MANIATTVWDFLKQNNHAIGTTTLFSDGSKLFKDIHFELTKPGEPDWIKLTELTLPH